MGNTKSNTSVSICVTNSGPRKLGNAGNRKGQITVSRYVTTRGGLDYIRWKVDIPATLAGTRIRKFFTSREEAENEAAAFRARIALKGTAGIEADNSHLLTVADAIRRFWSRKESVQGVHRRNFMTHLNRLSEQFGSAPISLINPIDLEDHWNRPTWGPTSRNHCFRYLRMFFNWCARYELIPRNPILRVDAPRAAEAPRAILTPEQMTAALAAATPPLRAFLALGGFAGLRTTEAMALPLSAVESDIVKVEAGKTGGRFVNRLPAFDAAWPAVEVTPKAARAFYMTLNNLARKIGLEAWPTNALRHSFATYHLSMWEDAPRTAFQMGHRSPQMIYQHYARAVRKEDAVRWWAIGSLTEG